MKKLLILGLTLTLTSSAYSYTLNSVAEAGARWRNFPIGMKLNPSNSGLPDTEVQRVITSAMGKWNTGIAVEVLQISALDYSVISAHGMDVDGTNSITFSNNFREDTNGFDPDVTVAVGGQYGNGDSMVNAFIIFNAESVAWDTDQYISSSSISYSDDLETIALHELGHVLGLGHTTVAGAVMNATRLTKTVRELSQDDIEGGQYLANEGASGSGNGIGKDASNTAGCSFLSVSNNRTTHNSNIGGMSAIMLLPLTILIFARKRAKAIN